MVSTLKSLKAYQRARLGALYKAHAVYLARAVKSLAEDEEEISAFCAKIPALRAEATCHEVALNNFFNTDLETHQNRLGKEREYKLLADQIAEERGVRPVGRDLRVRIVYTLLEEILSNAEQMSALQCYKSMQIKQHHVCCPICNARTYERVRVIDGVHSDGTTDYHYEYEQDNVCEHVLMFDFDSGELFADEDLERDLRTIEDNADLIELDEYMINYAGQLYALQEEFKLSNLLQVYFEDARDYIYYTERPEEYSWAAEEIVEALEYVASARGEELY